MAERFLLDGLRVVELATYVFAPGAATILSDFGAEVIKVERPGSGDPYRQLHALPPMPRSNLNYCWLLEGRNKKSIALNVACPEGRAILLALAATADVFVTNYHPSVLARLALAYNDLQAINDRLVYAHATGFGEAGEDVEQPGYDLTGYWARSGLMDRVHNGDAEPCPSVVGMGDHPSALSLFGGIMLALYARQRTGRGTKVMSSLLANGAWANGGLLQAALCGAEFYPHGTRVAAINPLVNHYVTRDGKRFIFCLIQPERDWPNLCRALGASELRDDPRYATLAARSEHAASLVAVLDEALGQKTMADWAQVFAAHGLTWSPVSTVAEAARDPQMHANDIFVPLDHPEHGRLPLVNSPLTLQGMPKVPPRPAPALGQHTREVLAGLGYAPAVIQRLVEQGVIAVDQESGAGAGGPDP
jgi:crotonobetainyl-CoA:carnitine CoA-transferase CaiB-like acyl-CoA transferase